MTRHFNRSSDKAKRQKLRGDMPKAEIILWSRLCRRQVAGAKFRRQYGVDQFVIDFYCPELKLAIELDGASHDSSEAQTYDQMRQQHIERFGIQFLRFRNQQVYEELNEIVDVIRERVMSLRR